MKRTGQYSDKECLPSQEETDDRKHLDLNFQVRPAPRDGQKVVEG